MNTKSLPITSPHFENCEMMTIAGLILRLNENADREIPALWQRLAPHLGKVPGQIGSADYGLCIRAEDDNCCFDYLAGIEIANMSAPSGALPSDWRIVNCPAQKYAVFTHDRHVSELHRSIHLIFDQWLPASNHQHAQNAGNPIHFFERYGEGFNPKTGFGDIELWLPINA